MSPSALDDPRQRAMTAPLRPPELSDAEWAAVLIALQHADRAGCGEIDPAGRGVVGTVRATLLGSERFHRHCHSPAGHTQPFRSTNRVWKARLNGSNQIGT